MPNPSDSDVVGYLYDAAMGDMSWSDVGLQIARLLGGVTVNMFVFRPTGQDVDPIATHGLTAGQLKTYADEFAVHDLWTQGVWRERAFNRTVIGSRVVPDATLRKSIIYNEFLRPTCDAFRFLGAAHQMHGGDLAVVSTHRPSDAADFADEQRRQMDQLLSHYVRALELRQRLSTTTAPDQSREILHHLAQGIIHLGPSGKVLMANAAAERMLRERDGLMTGSAGLLAVGRSENQRLQSLIRSALSVNGGGNGKPGGYLSVSRPSGRYPYRCMVTPLGRNRAVVGANQPAALLFVIDPEEPAIVDPQAVQALFGLTPAEARVAAGLAMGERLPVVAQRLGITFNTARTLLARATAKTHAESQLGLIRTILTTVPR